MKTFTIFLLLIIIPVKNLKASEDYGKWYIFEQSAEEKVNMIFTDGDNRYALQEWKNTLKSMSPRNRLNAISLEFSSVLSLQNYHEVFDALQKINSSQIYTISATQIYRSKRYELGESMGPIILMQNSLGIEMTVKLINEAINDESIEMKDGQMLIYLISDSTIMNK